MKPLKTRSVAWPRIRGPIDISPTLTTPSSTTRIALPRSGRIRATRRLPDGTKSIAFWPTMPPPIGPRPGPPCGASIRSVALNSLPLEVVVVLMLPPPR